MTRPLAESATQTPAESTATAVGCEPTGIETGAAPGARNVTSRLSFGGPVVVALPAVSALIIVGVGLAPTAKAVGQIA